jgi:hypothetical protein
VTSGTRHRDSSKLGAGTGNVRPRPRDAGGPDPPDADSAPAPPGVRDWSPSARAPPSALAGPAVVVLVIATARAEVEVERLPGHLFPLRLLLVGQDAGDLPHGLPPQGPVLLARLVAVLGVAGQVAYGTAELLGELPELLGLLLRQVQLLPELGVGQRPGPGELEGELIEPLALLGLQDDVQLLLHLFGGGQDQRPELLAPLPLLGLEQSPERLAVLLGHLLADLLDPVDLLVGQLQLVPHPAVQ